MIKKIIKSDNYNVAYFPPFAAHSISFAKKLQSDYNQKRDEELEFYKKIDNSILLSELCRGLEFYKSLTEKDRELFSVSTHQLSYLIGEDTQTIDYMGMTSLSLAKSKALKPNFVFDLKYLNLLSSSLLKNFITDFGITPILKLTHKDAELFKKYLLFSKINALTDSITSYVTEPAIDLDISSIQSSLMTESDSYILDAVMTTQLSFAKNGILSSNFLFDYIQLNTFPSVLSSRIESRLNLLRDFKLILKSNFVFDLVYLYDVILNKKYNQTSVQAYPINKTVNETLIFPIFQRGIDFSLSAIEKDISSYDYDLLSDKELNEDYNQIIIQDYLTSLSLMLDDSYVLDYLVPSILSLTKRKTFKPLFEIQSNYLMKKVIDTNIYISQFQRGLEFNLDSTNSFNSTILSSIEFSDRLCQSSNYQLIFDLLSSSFIELIPIITIPIALTTLSFAKTKIFSPSISFDNFLSSIDDLTSSSHFQLDIESLLTSTISFDDIYSLWKITSLFFSKNINFEYNQTQDFEIDLDIAQLLSKLITITPSVAALRIALKEILTFAKQIEVLAITKQITVTTTVKPISISISAQMG